MNEPDSQKKDDKRTVPVSQNVTEEPSPCHLNGTRSRNVGG